MSYSKAICNLFTLSAIAVGLSVSPQDAGAQNINTDPLKGAVPLTKELAKQYNLVVSPDAEAFKIRFDDSVLKPMYLYTTHKDEIYGWTTTKYSIIQNSKGIYNDIKCQTEESECTVMGKKRAMTVFDPESNSVQTTTTFYKYNGMDCVKGPDMVEKYSGSLEKILKSDGISVVPSLKK